MIHLALLRCLSSEPVIEPRSFEATTVVQVAEKRHRKKKKRKWRRSYRTVPDQPEPLAAPEVVVGDPEPVQEKNAPLPDLDRLAFPVRELAQTDREAFCQGVAIETLNKAVWPILAREEERPPAVTWQLLAMVLLGMGLGAAFVIPVRRRV